MNIDVRRSEYSEVEAMRGLYRHDANCQIIHDSALSRGIADPYLILVNGRIAGYGGVWNKYDPGRVMEFWVLPSLRSSAGAIFCELLAASGATHVEAQTNMALMLTMLYDFATNIVEENILFEDAFTSSLDCPAVLRRATPADGLSDGQWVLDADRAVVAAGGILFHYNPPFGDIYMDVPEHARRQGYGSYLVQELKRVCYESGHRPAARCNPSNHASRRTLEKAGLLPCGRLLAGAVKGESNEDAAPRAGKQT